MMDLEKIIDLYKDKLDLNIIDSVVKKLKEKLNHTSSESMRNILIENELQNLVVKRKLNFKAIPLDIRRKIID